MQQLALDTEDESRMEDAVAAAPASTDDAESAAALSHELNQPLAAIVASAQACSQWVSADPPNIERAKIAAERIICDAIAAAQMVERARRTRRPLTPVTLKGTNGRD
jgi:hypothetical protein